MESLALASPAPAPPRLTFARLSPQTVPLSIPRRTRRCRVAAAAAGPGNGSAAVESCGGRLAFLGKLGLPGFASVSSSLSATTAAVSPPPLVPPPSPSYFGGPILWISVGVGLSAVFSAITARTKKYLMQQAFKSMFDQAASQNSQFGNPAFSGGPSFPFPAAPQPPPTVMSSFPSVQAMPQSSTVEESKNEAETIYTPEILEKAETKREAKKFAFVDISREELLQKEREYEQESINVSTETTEFEKKVSPNGAAFRPSEGASAEQSRNSKAGPVLSVDALEKMMEDPTVQKMVYPYLPEEMRNPTTFKWMLQNPQYRQQLQEILDKMGGNADWDTQMMENLKNFDLSSPEVKQQFEQIGLTPEEVVSKIMANPDVTQAFQNPKIQAAIMDCSQNPMNIAKYQNDKEIMDVFNRISELFPGVGGM